jgi:nucleotide-binding universal stress UspA family protein
MAFPTIMVHVDDQSSNDACLRVAVDLAEQFDAKLIGIAAADLPWSYLAQESVSFALIEQLRSDTTKRSANAEERFRSATSRFAKQTEWRSAMAPPANYIAHQARAADLIVVSAYQDGLLLDASAGQLDPGDLIMQGGRAVLIVPPKTERLSLKSA